MNHSTNLLQSLGLTSVNDPKPSQTTNNSTQQHITVKVKSRPKKKDRLHVEGSNNSLKREGFVDDIALKLFANESGETNCNSSNGQLSSNLERKQEERKINPEKSDATNSSIGNSTISIGSSSNPSITSPFQAPVIKPILIMRTSPKKHSLPSTGLPQGTAASSQSTQIPSIGTKPEPVTPKQASTPQKQFNGSITTARPHNLVSPPFDWDTYLKLDPAAEFAPKEAFMQTQETLANRFIPGMKLEAKDPRNGTGWCLATVVSTEGLRIGLRFDGGDNTNDFFEVIDSENIQPFGREPVLQPPVAYHGNISSYQKFVDKVVSKPESVIAPENCFVKPPMRPSANLFKVGMVLEAIDKKHPHLICPARIDEIEGKDIKINFIGWSGSFDYSCAYTSRDIFPAGWCQRTGHPLANPPPVWKQKIGKHDDAKTTRSPAPKPTPSKESKVNTTKIAKTSRRGRPKKSAQNMNQSTPKKNTPLPKTIDLVDDDDEEDEDHDDSSYEMNGLYSYSGVPSCQRTVPYHEWRMLKINGGLDPPTTSTSVDTASSRVSESMSLGSSTSKPSTSYQEQGEVSFEDEKNQKKFKTDNEIKATNVDETNASKRYDLWTVGEIVNLIKTDESLVKYAEVFENHEIDGKAFALLTTDIMANHMGVKIGPALKINNLIDQIKRHN